MGISPLRDLGKIGVVTDVDPFDLPSTAFSMGVNVRFVDNRISAAPVWRKASDDLLGAPRFLFSYSDGVGTTSMFYASLDGRIRKCTASGVGVVTESDVTDPAWVPADYEAPYTGTFLNNVVYINRPDRVPWYAPKGSGGAFQELPNWNTQWRCDSIRAVGGVLVAVNVTKSGINYPQMVKWSDYSISGSVPGTWDGGTTNNAGENLLAEIPDRLIDGWPMRDRLVLYSETECWLMEQSGDSSVFNFRKAFGDGGVINQNCVADVGGVHYVFGQNEIYKHDGIQKLPFAIGVVNNFIFTNIVKSRARDCFVVHNPKLSEIMFCYPSQDGYVSFPWDNTKHGCNRAAVYNYRAGTWYFYSLPYVSGACYASLNVEDSYTDTTATYDSIGGTYLSFSDGAQIALFLAGNQGEVIDGSPVPARLRSFELVNSASHNGPYDPLVTHKGFIERLDFDLDELGMELRGNKCLRSIYPEGRAEHGAQPMQFTVGIKLYPNEMTQWFSTQTFDGDVDYKLDYNAAGRYLSLKALFDPSKRWSLNALDFDIIVLSRR